MHTSPALRAPVNRPHHLDRSIKESRPEAGTPNDPVAREYPLAEPVHHVSRTEAVERPADEVELKVRSPGGGARAPTDAKSLELLLAGLALAEMRLQRDALGQPDVRVEERREMLASVLAVHGKRHLQLPD